MNDFQQGKPGPVKRSRSIPTSRSLDFQRLRNSFMRKTKKRDAWEETSRADEGLPARSDSLRDLRPVASGENILDGGKRLSKGTGSMTDASDVETTGLVPYGMGSASRESLKDKFLNRMRNLSSSKDDIDSGESKIKISPRRSLSVNTPKRGSLFDRVKELYNSKEVLDKADVKGNDFHNDSQWTGVVLLNKLYNKEESRVRPSEENGPVTLKMKSKAEDSYWKGVRFLDKAQNIYEHPDVDEYDLQDQLRLKDQTRRTTDDEQCPAEGSEDPRKKESPSQGSRGHARPRGSMVSLNGSLHSLSSLPSSPPPGSGYVLRNSKFANQKRGKVARQAFQAYPKSFNQMRKKLSKRFSGRRKVSTLTSSCMR